MSLRDLRRRRRVLDKQKADARIKGVQNRECGDCQACCEVMGVTELDKPPQTRCQHQCAAGCGIYAIKPATCSTYSCMWLLGNILTDEARPDKCGIIFDSPINNVLPNLVCVREVWEGAIENNPKMKATLYQMMEKVPLLIVYRNGKRTILTTDPAVAKRAHEIIAAYGKGVKVE